MTCLIGVDVGGTKIAAGLVMLPSGRVLARRLQPTLPERGGEAVLADVIALVRSLQDEATRLNTRPCALGVGLAELVSPAGEILDQATIRWIDLPVVARIESETSLTVTIEADVRAAARAEAELGTGRDRPSFLYVTVGTGISACLMLGGSPYTGARGLAGSFASSPVMVPTENGDLVAGPPLEKFAGGPALARRLAERRLNFRGAAPEVLALAEAGDGDAHHVVDSAGRALGAAMAQLVNVLDPPAIVLGGGLGLAGGLYRRSLEAALRGHIYSDHHRDVPLLNAALGADAGWIGAALAADRFTAVKGLR